MKPRRTGKVSEYQNGRYFMYVTEWDEADQDARSHKEIEVYYSPSFRKFEFNYQDADWHSTDPGIFEEALRLFFEDPEVFVDTSKAKLLPNKTPQPRPNTS